jgi:hypothetical protein
MFCRYKMKEVVPEFLIANDEASPLRVEDSFRLRAYEDRRFDNLFRHKHIGSAPASLALS